MDHKIGALSGILATFTLYISIGICIIYSPWFSWEKNALSDLGHVLQSSVAPLFNFGLMLSGILLVIFAFYGLKGSLKMTYYWLLISGFTLQLVGGFNESYGNLHFFVSVALFISLFMTSVFYFAEKKSPYGLLGLLPIILWVAHFTGFINTGAAIPEISTGITMTPLIITSAWKVYKNAEKGKKLKS